MKKLLMAIAFVCALVIAYAVAPSNVDASAKRTVYKVAVSTVDVKATAKTDAKKVVTLKKNAYVTVLSSSNGWSNVLVNGKKGYVKTGQLVKAKATSKVVSLKAGLKIYATASTKAKIYSTVKQNGKVSDFGKVNSQFSFVQVGNVTGYALTKSLKAPKVTVKTVSFYQGLVPIGIKNTETYGYFVSSSYGYDGYAFNKFTYSGSKAKGSFALTMSQKQDAYTTVKYSETKKGFTYVPDNNRPTVMIDYPAKVGNKKTYTLKMREYDEKGNDKMVSYKVTSTVKVVKDNYTNRFGKVFKDVVVVQLTGPNKLNATYVFKLNKGLVHSNFEKLSEDYLFGESVNLE